MHRLPGGLKSTTDVVDGCRLTAKISSYCHPLSGESLFRDMEFSLEAGKINCLLGLSGVGKTTLLRVLLGTAPGSFQGSVTFSSKNRYLSSQEARRSGLVGVLAQDASLLPWLTVMGNILLPARLNKSLHAPNEETAAHLLATFGLSSKSYKRNAHELSRGMQQRVALARALIYNPVFVFLDEFFSNLDAATAGIVAKSLSAYTAQQASVCLLVTHDVDRALSIANRLFHLTADGTLEELPATVTKHDMVIRLGVDNARLSREVS